MKTDISNVDGLMAAVVLLETITGSVVLIMAAMTAMAVTNPALDSVTQAEAACKTPIK